ncbi:MAG: sorbosone dehydrogenase, partial [Imperialibacter sp.]
MRTTSSDWLRAGAAFFISLSIFSCSPSEKQFDKTPQLSTPQDTINLPVVLLPEGADTTNAYWQGIDLEPKKPVIPLPVNGEKARFLLQPGYSLEPILTEPQIQQPGAITFDGNGRMYVLELRTYMLTADSEGTLEPVSAISRWEDKDNDGIYETGRTFV